MHRREGRCFKRLVDPLRKFQQAHAQAIRKHLLIARLQPQCFEDGYTGGVGRECLPLATRLQGQAQVLQPFTEAPAALQGLTQRGGLVGNQLQLGWQIG